MRNLGTVLAAVVAVAAITVMGAGVAEAREWVLVNVSENAGTAINRSSVRGGPSEKTAWFALMLPHTSDSGMDYALIQRVFDCERETAQTVMAAIYTAEGNSLGSGPRDDPMEPVVIDSVDHKMLAAACRDEIEFPDPDGWNAVPAMIRDYRTSFGD